MKSIQILIPTYNKTKEDLSTINNFLKIKTNSLFANQIDNDDKYFISSDDKTISVVCSKSKGVSINRNILNKYADGDINVCIDDDCPLVDNYEQIVESFYEKHPDAEAVIFNGVWSTHGNKLVHNKKTKRVRHYCDISYAGGPGFTFRKGVIEKYHLKYNENVGYPNYICAGEDSLFYRDLVKSGARVYRSSEVIFNVVLDQTNSSYYKGINEQYVVTRGCITKAIHPYLFILYKWRHIFRFKKQGTELSIRELNKYMKKGSHITI